MKLYELSSNYQQVLEMIEEGELDYQDTLESIGDAIEDKAENVAKVIKSIDAQVAVIKAEEKRLSERRRALENESKSLKVYLQDNLETAGIKKVKGTLLTVSIQKNPPSLDVNDDAVIPENYYIEQEPKLDKKTLLNDVKGGLEIEGVQIKRGESVRIR